MIGITSYGAYIPRTRLPLSVIGGRPPKEGGPERAVAWNDEDAVTLGAAAAIHCLNPRETRSITPTAWRNRRRAL